MNGRHRRVQPQKPRPSHASGSLRVDHRAVKSAGSPPHSLSRAGRGLGEGSSATDRACSTPPPASLKGESLSRHAPDPDPDPHRLMDPANPPYATAGSMSRSPTSSPLDRGAPNVPNLNMLGLRPTNIYGSDTLDDGFEVLCAPRPARPGKPGPADRLPPDQRRGRAGHLGAGMPRPRRRDRDQPGGLQPHLGRTAGRTAGGRAAGDRGARRPTSTAAMRSATIPMSRRAATGRDLQLRHQVATALALTAIADLVQNRA